ncbi:hypothetical protein ACFQZZ_00415 [Nocardia sp. GCM10030253]|uniref:hypothetical protein n=1 Tax=Nocardia sp. GCM10030253 TaxID=3273404 RepID=UPI00363463A9
MRFPSLYRRNGKQPSERFDTFDAAERWKSILDLVGVGEVLRILYAEQDAEDLPPTVLLGPGWVFPHKGRRAGGALR